MPLVTKAYLILAQHRKGHNPIYEFVHQVNVFEVPLGGVEQYVLSRAKVNSEPDTDTPGKTGMPYPILLGATFISSNLSEMH